jgi:hypothetical protein
MKVENQATGYQTLFEKVPSRVRLALNYSEGTHVVMVEDIVS